MLATTVLIFALATTGFAQTVPAGYRTVYLTSMVNTKFAIEPKTATNGSAIVVNTLDNKPDQQWYIKDGNTTIQFAGSTLCIDAGAKSNWKDMAAISLKTCDSTEAGQQWNVMADGRIALAPSSPQECLDLQYARATANNPVGLYSCAGLANAGAGDKGINWPPVNATS